jgi:hypothetical protein
MTILIGLLSRWKLSAKKRIKLLLGWIRLLHSWIESNSNKLKEIVIVIAIVLIIKE